MLMYNSGNDVKVTLNDLQGMATPAPLGNRHNTYPFYNFASDTVNSIQNAGYNILGQEFAVTKYGNRLFGLLKVRKNNISNLPTVSTGHLSHNMLVGLRGSHDQRFSRGLLIGSQVIVCSNLCFHGNLGNWKSKQTTFINERIPTMIEDAVTGLDNANAKLTLSFDRLNDTPISKERGDNLLVEIYRRGGFSSSQLGRAIDDWEKPSIEEHTSNGRNAWWLFNSATHALKPTGANANHNDLQERSTIVYNNVVSALPLAA